MKLDDLQAQALKTSVYPQKLFDCTFPTLQAGGLELRSWVKQSVPGHIGNNGDIQQQA